MRRALDRRRAPRPPPRPPARPLVMLALMLALVAGAYFYLAAVAAGTFELRLPGLPSTAGIELAPAPPHELRIERLGSRSGALSGRQRALVDELSRRHAGIPLTGHSLGDLRALQLILDKHVLEPDQTYELQALGVALGDVMAEQLGLEWVDVEDELGESRALRFEDSEHLFFPVTMISRRVERAVPFTVRELYDKTAVAVEALRERQRRPRRAAPPDPRTDTTGTPV